MSKKSTPFSKNSATLVIFNEIYRFAKRKCRQIIGPTVRSRAIKSYLNSHTVRKLQIGAGSNILSGWLNTNAPKFSRKVIFLDATKRFPFEDFTFDYIFCEHQIEHLTYEGGLFMLRECFRVLKSGGEIRVATPSLETLLGLLAPVKSELQQRYIKWVVDKYIPGVAVYREPFAINNSFYNHWHRFLYDRETLQGSLEEAGFVDVTPWPVGQSDDEVFQGIEQHGRDIGDEEINAFETMVLESKRP
jgi:predicted SAM-dependent methyltransferase